MFYSVLIVVNNGNLANCIYFEEDVSDEDREETSRRFKKAINTMKKQFVIDIFPTEKETAAYIYERALYEQSRKHTDFSRSNTKSKPLNEKREYLIQGFIDVGGIKSKQIIDEFETPLKFIEALKDTEVLQTKKGEDKGISGPLEKIPRLGHKFVRNNQELMGL